MDQPPELCLTELELRQYNGERGRPAYIACDGVVYDVSDAPNWRGGMHREMHYAGLDLTRSLRKAPHDASVFVRVRRVGRIVDAVESSRVDPSGQTPAQWGGCIPCPLN